MGSVRSSVVFWTTECFPLLMISSNRVLSSSNHDTKPCDLFRVSLNISSWVLPLEQMNYWFVLYILTNFACTRSLRDQISFSVAHTYLFCTPSFISNSTVMKPQWDISFVYIFRTLSRRITFGEQFSTTLSPHYYDYLTTIYSRKTLSTPPLFRPKSLCDFIY